MFILKNKIKKDSTNILNNNSGVTALLMTILVLTSILGVTLSVAGIVRRGISMNWEAVHSVKALFASEGGMERILYENRKGDVLDFNNAIDTVGVVDCVTFTGGVIDVNPLLSTHINVDNTCFGAPGENNNVITLSNGATYRIEYENDSTNPALNVITLTSYGVYENQNRVIKSSYSIYQCGASTATKPGCMVAGPLNSHDNLYYCGGGDFCFECDYGWKDCDGGNDDCATQLGTNTNCQDCGDVCPCPDGGSCSVCLGIDTGCSVP